MNACTYRLIDKKCGKRNGSKHCLKHRKLKCVVCKGIAHGDCPHCGGPICGRCTSAAVEFGTTEAHTILAKDN